MAFWPPFGWLMVSCWLPGPPGPSPHSSFPAAQPTAYNQNHRSWNRSPNPLSHRPPGTDISPLTTSPSATSPWSPNPPRDGDSPLPWAAVQCWPLFGAQIVPQLQPDPPQRTFSPSPPVPSPFPADRDRPLLHCSLLSGVAQSAEFSLSPSAPHRPIPLPQPLPTALPTAPHVPSSAIQRDGHLLLCSPHYCCYKPGRRWPSWPPGHNAGSYSAAFLPPCGSAPSRSCPTHVMGLLAR